MGKPQFVRLVDVFFLAPLMVYTAVKYKQVPKSMRIAIFTSGVLTAFYNGRNYLLQRKIDKLKPLPGENKNIHYARMLN